MSLRNYEENKNAHVLFGIKVASASRPGYNYIVKIYSTGDMNCTKEESPEEGCVASEMGKVCRHQKHALGKLQNITLEAYKKYGQKNI